MIVDSSAIIAILLKEPGWAEIEVVEFTADHWTVAADAFIRYGNGRHPARLNFGDCMNLCRGQACRRATAVPRR